MPCQYAEAGNMATVSSSNKTALLIGSIAGLRPRIYEFSLGPNDAPNATDCSVTVTLQIWTTSAGTTTAVTPFPTDPGYQAAKCSAGSNASGEPTYTAGSVFWAMGVNQRATYRWQTDPRGSGVLTLVGTATTGAGWQVLSSNYVGKYLIDAKHEE